MVSLFSCFPFNAEAHHPTGYGSFPSAAYEYAQSVCARQHPFSGALPHIANDLWTVKAAGYLRVDCAGPLVINAEGGATAQRRFGPFEHFSFVDSTAFADRDRVFRSLLI